MKEIDEAATQLNTAIEAIFMNPSELIKVYENLVNAQKSTNFVSILFESQKVADTKVEKFFKEINLYQDLQGRIFFLRNLYKKRFNCCYFVVNNKLTFKAIQIDGFVLFF